MIDPNEAPDGCTAIKPHRPGSCKGCVFSGEAYCETHHCGKGERIDGQEVIFIKRDEAPAHAVMTPKQVRDALFMSVMELHRLRDEFAKAAMGEVYSTAVHEASQGSGLFATPDWRVEIALDAYAQADAMLHAKFATMTWGQK